MPLIDIPVVKPNVDSEVLTTIDSWTLEDQHVYVHCYYKNDLPEMLIRVWRSTFLVDKVSGVKSELVHAEKISIAPQWTIIRGKVTFSFLLIFSALPKNCKVFDLVEDIPQAGGFYVPGIKRNELDVYHVDIL
jgi:hypothetical protein